MESQIRLKSGTVLGLSVHRSVVIYGLTVAAVAVAWLVRWMLDPTLGDLYPYATFFVAVAIAAGLGGWRSALAATTLGFALAEYFFVPPHVPRDDTSLYLLGVAMYFVVSMAFAGIGEAMVQARERAKARRELLRTTLASIGDAVVVTDNENRITFLNAVAESMIGWTRREAAGQQLENAFRIVHESTRVPVENPTKKALQESSIVALVDRTVLIGKDGTERPVEISAAPIRDDRDQIIGCVLTFRDITMRRRAEATLQVSEERFARFMQHLPGLAWIKDLQGRYVYVNQAAERAFQMPAAELYGKTDAEVFPPETAAQFKTLDLQALATAQGVQAIETLEHSDGVVHHSIVSKFPILGADGTIGHVGGMAIDITERKQAEDALRESEERYRTLFNSIDEGFCVIEMIFDARNKPVDYRFLLVSPSFEKQTGIKNAVGKTMREIAPNHEEYWFEIYGNIALTGEPARFVNRAVALRRWYDVYAFRYGKPDERQVGIIFNDITQRKQSEEAIHDSAQRFEMLADNISQFAWMADAKGWVIWFNQRWYDYTGTTIEEVQGDRWKDYVHPDYVDRVATTIQQSWDTGQPLEDTFPLRGRDGSYRWFLSRALPIRDENGKVVRWFGTNTDITEQRAMEDKLRQYAADMTEADRRKTEFIAMLAHELRNPLAPIRNTLQVMKRTPGVSESVVTATQMMERQVAQMVRLVDDLLDVSRVSRGKIELRTERIELALVVNHAVETVRPHCEKHGHQLSVTLPPEQVYLNGDPTRLTQVISNLLNNACKFTEKGGQIWLTVNVVGSAAEIRVRDNGIGLAAEQLTRIFDMFVQVDTSLERTVSGLGIGLTLVKTLVEMHGGTVEVHSAGIGRGSEFVIRLPILTEVPQVTPEPMEKTPTPAKPRRILVVDDNRDSAISLAELLQLIGNETRTAFDGLEAVEAAEAFRPDVVLLDIGLPKLNGYEACRRIRAQPQTNGMVLVALTGWGQEEDRQKSREAGFNAHMVKPVDLPALIKLLAALTAKQA